LVSPCCLSVFWAASAAALDGAQTLQLLKVGVAALYGLASLYQIIGFGLFRASPSSPIVTGTWLAAASGLLWYLASVIPLIWPDRVFAGAACNIGAATAAAGSAAFLVPDDKLSLIRSTFGLG
jgi:hypothetical protein